MAFIGEKSTGWSGPQGDFIQELQESLLRLKLMADSTMNSRLTTAACPPRDIPISCVSAERYQSAIKKRTEGGKVKERKRGLGREIKTGRLRGAGGRMHPFISSGKTVKYKCSIQVCDAPS